LTFGVSSLDGAYSGSGPLEFSSFGTSTAGTAFFDFFFGASSFDGSAGVSASG
jgi:hypothetical protein